jgi:hypothetical protein
MPLPYNPIVRTFGQLRTVLVNVLGVDRRLICPAVPLGTLIPVDRRREVLDRLREAGLPPPELQHRVLVCPLGAILAVVAPCAIIVPLALESWIAFLIGLGIVFAVGWLVWRTMYFKIVEVPLPAKTVGELVIYLTHFAEHKGYPFSRAEIALKVRFMVAESLGIDIDEVREESSLIELGAD